VQERAREAVIVARVRRRLEAEESIALPEGRVSVGRKADGTMRQHTFALVAENRSMVGEVRTYTLGEGGGRPSGKFAHCYAACLFLFRAKARRKMLVLTDHAFWSRFRRESEGLVEGIEIIHVPVEDSAPIMIDEPAELAPEPVGARRAPASSQRPGADRPRSFTREDEIPVPRRNRGGPGPKGRHPNTGSRRGR
jgi:hypothetical protein